MVDFLTYLIFYGYIVTCIGFVSKTGSERWYAQIGYFILTLFILPIVIGYLLYENFTNDER